MKSNENPPSIAAIARDLTQPIVRYLERYVGDRALAQDLAQETLIRMERGLVGFDGRASIKTWAFAIATRVAADHLRRPESRARIVELDEAAELADTQEAVGERMVVDEMGACVRQVIDSLPATYRAAIVLHDIEGLTCEEVAAICECSVATAKIRVHRARARLREALNQQCDFYRAEGGVFRCDRKAAGEP